MVTNETQEQLEARGWDFTEEFIPDEPTVNNQDKTVDVSENGTIEVTPDEGFTGLGKVTVNTNVEGGGSIEYLDVSGLGETNESLRNVLAIFADIVKSKNEEGTFVGACLSGIQTLFGFTTNSATTCVAVAVDFSSHIKGVGNEAGQVVEMSFFDVLVTTLGATQDQLDAIPRITKEQFYDLNM